MRKDRVKARVHCLHPFVHSLAPSWHGFTNLISSEPPREHEPTKNFPGRQGLHPAGKTVSSHSMFFPVCFLFSSFVSLLPLRGIIYLAACSASEMESPRICDRSFVLGFGYHNDFVMYSMFFALISSLKDIILYTFFVLVINFLTLKGHSL